MRNQIIDQLRGLCMLGVIGIHVGSVSTAANNYILYLLLEILSRYSVPSFFFVSGYGLFYAEKQLRQSGTLGDFDYWSFIKKRLRGAGLPYVTWSIFFTLYFWYVLPRGWVRLNPLYVAYNLFFGLCCYHLYFMVILLWFYGSYPLWRKFMVWLLKHKLILTLPLLFVFNLVFNWFSINYNLNTTSWPLLLQKFYEFRLNYVPFHYLLIFMSGGLAALYWEKFIGWLRQHSLLVLGIYVLSLIYDLGSCWYAHHYLHYTLSDLANTYHQLSPQGLCYTVASLLTFCAALDWLERRCQATEAKPSWWQQGLYKTINVLSAYATLIYFVHPLFLDIYTTYAKVHGIVLTSKKIVFLYLLLTLSALLCSMALEQSFKRCSWLKLLCTGKK